MSDEYIKKSDAINAVDRLCRWHEKDGSWLTSTDVIVAIKKIQPADVVERSRHEEIVTAYINGLENIINELKEERRWIPCAERLPEYDGAYLATIKGRTITGEYTIIVDLAYRFKHTWSHDYGIADILAWMPLPQPYKEKNDE